MRFRIIWRNHTRRSRGLSGILKKMEGQTVRYAKLVPRLSFAGFYPANRNFSLASYRFINSHCFRPESKGSNICLYTNVNIIVYDSTPLYERICFDNCTLAYILDEMYFNYKIRNKFVQWNITVRLNCSLKEHITIKLSHVIVKPDSIRFSWKYFIT